MEINYSNDFLTYKELIDAFENDNTDNYFKTATGFLINAVSFWPVMQIHETKDLVLELKQEIHEELTFENLDNYLKQLCPTETLWKMDALTALLELFDFDRNSHFDKNIELDEIIIKISKHYRKEKQ
jgi:hypothetical protein